ncbi:MAG: type I-U CRISPR-associated helicase/endonuclease Cas3 [Nocardioidaceae bacterium]
MTVTFADFYESVHGHAPFPWQDRLAARVLDDGAWPQQIDVPTGLGKTSVLDVATYVAAFASDGPSTPRRRRAFFVIDRRVVVDEAFEHAQRLAGALSLDADSAAGHVARQLRSKGLLHRSRIVVERMRGGTTWSWNWMPRPDVFGIVVGTVDQLGSRLLFRGYGLGPRLAPIDAALVGRDSLIVVDEAHLARPLQSTLARIEELDVVESPIALPRPTIVTMSATNRADVSGAAHTLSADDHADAVAARRLHAPKRLHLREVAKPVDIAPTMARFAEALAATPGSVVGVVCNTVARARAVHDALSAERAVLLTGRVRPFDRERNQAEFLPRFMVGRKRTSDSTIVVATQTIEVGVNADFDALVTEVAPWSAIVQRLGRVNRVGDRMEPATVIVVADGSVAPPYGDAAARTWTWLAEREPSRRARGAELPMAGGLDVSVAAVLALSREINDHHDLELAAPSIPTITSVQLDTWAQTAPIPATDTPVGPYLHGFGRDDPQIQLVWRADLSARQDRGALLETVARKPPVSDEMLEVSLAAVRRWLTGQPGADAVADAPIAGDVETTGVVDLREVDVWAVLNRAGEASRVIDLGDDRARADLRPNDVLVLPSEAGGCDRWGWRPRGRDAVEDIADRIDALRSTWTLRVEHGPLLSLLRGDADEARRLTNEIIEAVEQDHIECRDELVEELLLRAGLDAAGVRSEVAVSGPGVAGVLFRMEKDGGAATDLDSAVRDDVFESSAVGRGAVTLSVHSAAVRDRARTFASALGLPRDLAAVVEAAAAWHDVGKLDPRFQTALRGGADLLAGDGEPLAKSGIDPSDRAAFRRAHRVAGIPQGFRHEVGSAQAAAQHATTLDIVDVDLFVHLVAAHHGHSRPLFPPVGDTSEPFVVNWDGRVVELDFGRAIDWAGPSRFDLLNRRYGRWGLAFLETVVRLADIECSREGT